jgi:hypothetical protein
MTVVAPMKTLFRHAPEQSNVNNEKLEPAHPGIIAGTSRSI